MIKQEALENLKSQSTHSRLQAARFLARHAEAKDLPLLRTANSLESDHYVGSSLQRAIDRLTRTPSTLVEDSPEEDETLDFGHRQIYARATEWIAGLLLHEISSPLGLIAYAASREITNYETSQTKNHINTLQMTFDAIEQLRKASATPKPTEFNLSDLIEEIVHTEFEELANRVALQGPKPLILLSDPALLRFSICNGLRNAIEAESPESIIASPIVVTWGLTDVDYWISIIDKGPGMTKPIETLLGIGTTTKEGHSGFGLAIASAAMNAIEGALKLENAVGGGAKYELRWPK